MKEIWTDVDGFKGAYQISNTGKVRSFIKIYRDDELKIRSQIDRNITPKIIKQHPNIAGYMRVNLKEKIYFVHRLVASAFIPNPERKKCVNHIDGNHLNNKVDNLEWNTYSENNKHAYEKGLKKMTNKMKKAIGQANKGSKHGMTKLTEIDVLDIRNTYDLKCFSQREIADAYGVTRGCIKSIVNRVNWKHV